MRALAVVLFSLIGVLGVVFLVTAFLLLACGYWDYGLRVYSRTPEKLIFVSLVGIIVLTPLAALAVCA